MSILFKPDGKLNVATDPCDLPEEAQGNKIFSESMTRCKNLRLDQMGVAKLGDGSSKINPTRENQIDFSDEGYIKVHRKSIQSRVFQNEGLWKVWTWCLMRANYEDRWIPLKTGRGITEVLVKRGQFIFGRKSAAKELKMKPSTVQDRIKKLANMQNLVHKSVIHYSTITICNYDFYQSETKKNRHPNSSTNRQPTVTNKNNKKKNILRDSPNPAVREFIDFWYQSFQDKFGQPYTVNGGKEGGLIKTLLKNHSIERMKELAGIFFKSEDPFIKKSGYTIGVFYSQINKLAAVKASRW